MTVSIDHAARLAAIWLTNAEKDDPAIRESLKEIFKDFKAQKIMPAVFISGEKDLIEETATLLKYNRRRCAEIAVKGK